MLYSALGGPERFYDQGIFRYWRKDVSVPQTLIALALVTILRVLFLRVELRVSQYFTDMRDRTEERKVAPDVNTAKADEPVEKLTAIDEWKAVLQRVLACSNHAKAMISVGILVNIVLAVTESAWFAYYSAIEAGQGD